MSIPIAQIGHARKKNRWTTTQARTRNQKNAFRFLSSPALCGCSSAHLGVSWTETREAAPLPPAMTPVRYLQRASNYRGPARPAPLSLPQRARLRLLEGPPDPRRRRWTSCYGFRDSASCLLRMLGRAAQPCVNNSSSSSSYLSPPFLSDPLCIGVRDGAQAVQPDAPLSCRGETAFQQRAEGETRGTWKSKPWEPLLSRSEENYIAFFPIPGKSFGLSSFVGDFHVLSPT